MRRNERAILLDTLKLYEMKSQSTQYVATYSNWGMQTLSVNIFCTFKKIVAHQMLSLALCTACAQWSAEETYQARGHTRFSNQEKLLCSALRNVVSVGYFYHTIYLVRIVLQWCSSDYSICLDLYSIFWFSRPQNNSAVLLSCCYMSSCQKSEFSTHWLLRHNSKYPCSVQFLIVYRSTKWERRKCTTYKYLVI